MIDMDATSTKFLGNSYTSVTLFMFIENVFNHFLQSFILNML
nr:hypothetical protein B574_26165 [Salmonella enterica subsp. enterica serovar Typhimurium str. STm4]